MVTVDLGGEAELLSEQRAVYDMAARRKFTVSGIFTWLSVAGK